MKKLWAEFKKFIARGNVVDMAVGVIIGAAFKAIVDSLVKDIITPVISLISGGKSLTELKVVLRDAYINDAGIEVAEVAIKYGALIESVVNFLLIALTIFIALKVVTSIQKTLRFNQTMQENVQKKLDADEELNPVEEKWLEKRIKKDPEHAPKKTIPAPPAPVEPSSTDKLLMEILDQLKKDNN